MQSLNKATQGPFITTQDIYDLGVTPSLLSIWLTNGLLQVAYKNKVERFFWRAEVEKLILEHKE